MGDKVKLNNLIKKIEVIKKIEKINEVTKELIKNQWFLSVVFLVLAILTIFSTLFGNIMYTIFNPLLFGTSVGKIGVLFLWLGICFLPFKLISKFIEKIKFDRIKFDRIKNDRIKARIILFSDLL